jgi:hypothetical protein
MTAVFVKFQRERPLKKAAVTHMAKPAVIKTEDQPLTWTSQNQKGIQACPKSLFDVNFLNIL